MDRAVTPVVGVTLLVAITVLTATVVGTAVLATDVPTEPTRVIISLSADAATDRITLVHRGGATLNVSRLSFFIEINGKSLANQPPIPFFAAAGYRGGPTGPFNSATDPLWTASEVATLHLASTNAPAIDPDDVVSVTIRQHGRVLLRLSTRAV